jgi:hypothetical protein
MLSGLVELTEVGEPGAEALGPERIDAKHVRNKAESVACLREQPLQAGRQVGLVGNREPGAGVGIGFGVVRGV